MMKMYWLTISQSCYLSNARRYPRIPHRHNSQRLPHSNKPQSLAHNNNLGRLIRSVSESIGAGNTAKASPSGASFGHSWYSHKHLYWGCNSAAAQWIGRWSHSPWCLFACGAGRSLIRWGVNQSTGCIGADGCYVSVRIWFFWVMH